ncbi:MAG: hypothetical protein EXS05_04045 [Planctomycetaceae bacterium]|nr:hypothetical protein [Planctomycetaceae bacterium]
MGKNRKSNLLSWVWFIAAIAVPLVLIEGHSWAFAALGVQRLVGVQWLVWHYIFFAAVVGIYLLMMRVAKSYDEDPAPVELSAPRSTAEIRMARLYNACVTVGFVVMFGPSPWKGIAWLHTRETRDAWLFWGSTALMLMGRLLGRKSRRQWPFNPPAASPHGLPN